MSTVFLRTACRCKYIQKHHVLKAFKRYLLSDAYKCQDAWIKRLDSPVLKMVEFTPLSIQIFEKLNDDNRSSVIDMDILANKLQDMKPTEVEFAESLFNRYFHTPDGLPVRDSMVTAVIRSYIELGLEQRVLNMIRQRLEYGLLPDFYSTNLLMDAFIKQSMFKEASLLASEVMLQEDYSNKTCYLLSLYSCVKHYKQHYTAVENLITEDIPPDNEDETYKTVAYIQDPYYDDHFDIKNEKLLHGKTMYFLGKQSNTVLGRSLQLVGLGLYEKFPKALKLLKKWILECEDEVVMQESIGDFKTQLENAPIRDPEKIVELALRTIDDKIYDLRLTQDEKDNCLKELEDLIGQVSQKLSSDSLENCVDSLVKKEVAQCESGDIDNQKKLFVKWTTEREELFEKQLQDFKKKEKEEEIKKRLRELQEKEEILSIFERKHKLDIAIRKGVKTSSEKNQLEVKQ